MFAPLASAYSKKLQADLQRGHGTNWDKQRRVFIKLLDYLERKFQAGAYFEEFSSYRRAADGRAGCTKTLQQDTTTTT